MLGDVGFWSGPALGTGSSCSDFVTRCSRYPADSSRSAHSVLLESRRIMDLLWQVVTAACFIAGVLAPILLLRFFFLRSERHWLSSHSTLVAVTGSLTVYICLGALVTLHLAKPYSYRIKTSPPDTSVAVDKPAPEKSSNSEKPTDTVEQERERAREEAQERERAGEEAREERRHEEQERPESAAPRDHDNVQDLSPLIGIVSVSNDDIFVLAKGKIAFDVPTEMKEAKPEKVEVRIAKGVDKDVANLLKKGLSSQTKVDELQVAPFMIVHLESAEKSVFEITPLTQDRQIITGDGYTTWAWTVRPLAAGKHTLYLTVGTRFTLPGRTEETQFRPLYETNISVQVDRIYEAKLFLSGYWQWFMGSLIIPLLGFVWRHWKRKSKATTLLP